MYYFVILYIPVCCLCCCLLPSSIHTLSYRPLIHLKYFWITLFFNAKVKIVFQQNVMWCFCYNCKIFFYRLFNYAWNDLNYFKVTITSESKDLLHNEKLLYCPLQIPTVIDITYKISFFIHNTMNNSIIFSIANCLLNISKTLKSCCFIVFR